MRAAAIEDLRGFLEMNPKQRGSGRSRVKKGGDVKL
jgi:hypothetical protein